MSSYPWDMEINERFGRLADEVAIEATQEALAQNGISVRVVENGEQAKQAVLEIIPEQAEVMNMVSMTLESVSVATEIVESGRFNSVRTQLKAMDDATQQREKRQLGAAPDWAIGSAHAVTQQGQVMIASNTGSQLPAYAYGAQHVVWVIGTQKIVKDLDEGFRRIYEYSLPLEHERAKKAYGTGSNVSKVLIINKEVQPGRLTAILVKEKLGF